MVEVNADNFEFHFEDSNKSYNGDKFVGLISEVLSELGLTGKIKRINVYPQIEGRNELFRERDWHPYGSEVILAICPSKYLDRPTLLHEFGHEADRRNPGFGWTPEMDMKGDNPLYDFMNLAWNISLDSRLSPRGLSREFRFKEYEEVVGEVHSDIFENAWKDPPRTYMEILELARKLQSMKT